MVGIDTNILLYAHDRSSHLFEPAKEFITSACEEGIIGLADLSLLEFYSVITDGRKIPGPLPPSEAAEIVKDILSADEFEVFCFNYLIFNKAVSYAKKHNIARYGINDVYIAQTLAHYGIDRIFTANIKDFKKFNFIKAVNPFDQPAPRSPLQAPCSIPYGRQSIDEKDVAAVCSVLRSDWLTTGPKVAEFEQAVADYVGAKYAVAVSNGTAALHAAMYAIGIGPGDEVIVPPMTFAASANCIVYQGGTPVFADVDLDTLLLDPAKVEEKITEKTRAIIGVDYAGHPCDWDKLREIADKHGLRLVADGCHALGAEYKGRKVGALADMTVFSFHPVKHITTGEGGMITTNNVELAECMRLFRTHGITRDPKQFASSEEVSAPSALRSMLSAPCSMPFYYEMLDLGYNYRMTDFQCALGISQLQKLPKFLEHRREIAARYDEAFADLSGITTLAVRKDSLHAYHLYVVKVDGDTLGIDRTTLFTNLRKKSIGVNVHYIPVHMHPFYRNKFNTGPGLCPVAEAAYEQIISIPMFPGMTDEDVEKVIVEVKK